jgi:hypothetical protein
VSNQRSQSIKVPPSELESHLRDHIGFLIGYATSYDGGELAAAKQMAHSLRLLLHHTDKSKALLRLLNLTKLKFLNTAEPYDPSNAVNWPQLVAVRCDGPSGRRDWLVPRGDPEKLPLKNQLEFSDWWNMPVLVAKKKRGVILYCRKEIVLNLANKDGGSHVDDALPLDYVELSRQNALGLMVRRAGTGERFSIGDPVLPSVRQITHETLRTLQRAVPESFPKPYVVGSFEPPPDNPSTGIPTAWDLELARL